MEEFAEIGAWAKANPVIGAQEMRETPDNSLDLGGLDQIIQGSDIAADRDTRPGRMTPVSLPPQMGPASVQEQIYMQDPWAKSKQLGELPQTPQVNRAPIRKELEVPVAMGETAAALGTGALSWLPQVGAQMLGALFPKEGESSYESSQRWGKALHPYVQYDPKTELGKQSTELALKPLETYQKYVTGPAAAGIRKGIGDNKIGTVMSIFTQLTGDLVAFKGLGISKEKISEAIPKAMAKVAKAKPHLTGQAYADAVVQETRQGYAERLDELTGKDIEPTLEGPVREPLDFRTDRPKVYGDKPGLSEEAYAQQVIDAVGKQPEAATPEQPVQEQLALPAPTTERGRGVTELPPLSPNPIALPSMSDLTSLDQIIQGREQFNQRIAEVERIRQQRRIQEIGLDNFLAEQRGQTAEPNVPSVELNNKERKVETIPVEKEKTGEGPLTDEAVDQFMEAEAWDEDGLFDWDFEDEVVDDVPALEPVNAEVKMQKKGTPTGVSVDDFPGWEVDANGFRTKKAAKAALEALPEQADIQVVKIIPADRKTGKFHLARRTDPEIREMLNAVKENNQEVLKLSESEQQELLETSLTSRRGPSAEALTVIEQEESRLQDIRKEAEAKANALAEEIARDTTELHVSAVKDEVSDWEKILEEEGMGDMGLEDAFSLEDLNDYESQQGAYEGGVELYSVGGAAYEGIKRVFRKVDLRSGKTERGLHMGFGTLFDEYEGKVPAEKSPFDTLTAIIDVESPFRAMNWPETGLSFKNTHSRQNFILNQVSKGIKKISNLQLTPEEYGTTALWAEMLPENRKGLPDKYQKVLPEVDSFFESAERLLKKHGNIKELFPQSAINRNLKTIETIRGGMEDLDAEGMKKSSAAIKELLKQNQQLSKTKYVPIVREWLDALHEENPAAFIGKGIGGILKQRKSISLADLYAAGKFKLEHIDIRKLMANYGWKLAKTVPLLDLREQALKEGGMTKDVKIAKEKGYVQLDPRKFPLFKGIWADPGMVHYMEAEWTAFNNSNALGRFMSIVKGAQFIWPGYLGFNNAKQGIAAGSYRSLKTPVYMKRAFMKWTGKDPVGYEEAQMNGVTSQPVASVRNTWDKLAFDSMYPWQERGLRVITNGLNLNPKNAFGVFKMLNNMYDVAHSMAWSFDELTRLVTNEYYLDKGYSPKEAAQMAAMAHGDYAGVSNQFRQSGAGLVAFTPTYKLAMAKFYKQMGEGLVKGIKGDEMLRYIYDSDVLRAKKEGINLKDVNYEAWEKAHKTGKATARAFAGTAIGLMAYTMAKDQAMISQGYERDILGYRYVKKVKTDEGTKEQVISIGGWDVLPQKFIWKAYNAIDAPDKNPVISKFLRAFQYELHPVISTFMFGLLDGKRVNGEPIYNMIDPPMTKAFKQADYLLDHWYPMLGKLNGDGFDKASLEQFNEQAAWWLKTLLLGDYYAYDRNIPEVRKAYRTLGIVEKGVKEIEAMSKKGKTPSQEQLKNLQTLIQRSTEE